MSEKIVLGRVKQEIESSQSYNPEKDSLFFCGESISIEKHSWDCGWYWGFGYIGNRRLHTHASVFTHELLWHNVEQVFERSIFKNNNQFWIFKDLLKQAYVLQECAEVYHYGGHCITDPKTEVIKNKNMQNKINKDLEKVLDSLWSLLENQYKAPKNHGGIE